MNRPASLVWMTGGRVGETMLTLARLGGSAVHQSLPTRGAWIRPDGAGEERRGSSVAPLALPGHGINVPGTEARRKEFPTRRAIWASHFVKIESSYPTKFAFCWLYRFYVRP